MFLVHNITKIIVMIRVVLMITNVILQVSRPFHSQHFQQKVRKDRVFDIVFLGVFKLPNFVIEVNWLIIALIDSCDWGWLG